MIFGAVIPGDRAEVLKRFSALLETHPTMKPLIVPGEILPEALREVKTPGTALYALARTAAEKFPEKERKND